MRLSNLQRAYRTTILGAVVGCMLAIGLSANAQTVNYPAVTPASSFTLNGDANLPGDSTIQLTTVDQNGNPAADNYDPSKLQEGSFYYNNVVNASKFTTSFRFKLTPWQEALDNGDPWADGIAFVIQNNAPTALGYAGSNLGYSPIGNSIAIKFKTFGLGDPYAGGDPSISTVSVLTNGQDPTGSGIGLTDLLTFGENFDLGNGSTFRADVTYVNSSLTMVLTNETAGKSITLKFAVNIPSYLGSNTGYAGFSGATGLFVSDQRILSWSYTEQGSNGTVVRPTVTSITPASVPTGTSAFQMTIAGAGFDGSSVAHLDNNALSTVSITPTSMVVTVPSNLLTTKKTYNLTVTTGGGGISNAVQFKVGVATSTSPNIQITGNWITGYDQTTGYQYVILLLENTGSTDITNLSFNNVRLYIDGVNYLNPVLFSQQPGALPAGNLADLKPGYKLLLRWDFWNAPDFANISVLGISDQGPFNAGIKALQFPEALD